MRSLSVPETFIRNFIGFEPLVRFSESLSESNFPPHNIEQIDENKYRLTLAIAGYAKEDVSISAKGGLLTITGSKDTETREYLYRGIALRDFTRTFRIGEHVEVIDATLENGLLVVNLERSVPEEEKAKIIAIT